jgi:hypothetical protein
LVTDLQLDNNDETRVRLNFNITMMDIKCDFVVVDVISVLGTEQNVSNHITKWHVDGNGIRQRYQGRNKQQKDLHLFDTSVTRSLEELHEDGEDAISLTEETFEYAKNQQEYLFVDFYASWYVSHPALRTRMERILFSRIMWLFSFLTLFCKLSYVYCVGVLIVVIYIQPGKHWRN